MKKYYEIGLSQHVTGSVKDDYQTTQYNSYEHNYWAFRRKAIEYSKHIGEDVVDGYRLDKDLDHLDKGLAAVRIICYCHTDETEYNILWDERYIDGECQGREYWE